ncbi:MAG: TrkH family potassium uptake protein [Deltaproteobacteria bacterium]|nr:TrkH family potassium uptake protein [Deltaproteobacteria bacterium]RLB10342.1 MAG: TrkH family potassium uptake protein [Deltaproteobacteria bacterium]
MRIQYTLHLIGIFIFFLGLIMTAPLLVSLLCKDGSHFAFIKAILVTTFSGLIIYFAFKDKNNTGLSHREGIAIVGIGWLVACFFGSLPYIFNNTFDSFINAFFESVSGFTTTGATVLNDIESIPCGILFWRSLTQWLGGMGIIVLSIAILPLLGVGGMQLYKAEVPTPIADRLRPRISETAKVLWKVYVFISLMEVFLLLLGGMDLLDALCHTFTTMATGGFSTKNASIGQYHSAYLDIVITFFMLLAGINFSLHYKFLKGNVKDFLKDPELRFFLALVGIFTVIVSLNINSQFDSILESFRYGAFQVCSIITTTGYTTADFDKWPELSRIILLICMFLGASAGSTGGGIKCLRIMLLLKHSYQEIFKIIHPHAIMQLKLGKRPLPLGVINSIGGFFTLYMTLFIFSSILLSFMGMDLISAMAAVAATIGNVGPGLGMVGPTQNYDMIPYLGKWLLILCMLLGRLEIYTIIILFIPEFWKK